MAVTLVQLALYDSEGRLILKKVRSDGSSDVEMHAGSDEKLKDKKEGSESAATARGARRSDPRAGKSPARPPANSNTVERELRETATYPILTLPVEITTEIFHRLPLKVGELGLQSNTAPLSLTAVCRSWRDIALSTPTLWSTMEICFAYIPSTVVAQPGLVELFITQWLRRSGECPLSLTLTLRRTRRRGHEVHFPISRAANVCCDVRIETRVFSSAPLLHSLHLGGEGVIATRLHLPWQQLSIFEASIHNLDLFVVAPNLVNIKCGWAGGDSNPGMITHSCIKSFAVTDSAYDKILQYLTLPALQHLDLSEGDTYDFLGSFLERSSPPLISLRVQADDPAFAQWHQALVHVAATLEDIEISYASTEAMTSLLSLGERPWASPPWRTLNVLRNIKTLRLPHVVDPVGLYQLVKFLYSRSDKLRSFQLVWETSPFLDERTRAGAAGALDTPDTEDTIVGHFSRLQAAGMDIYVGTQVKNYAVTIE
ncbi:hypothetical protein B0H16DRAFT_1681629 [Mycena metata]|uniref:F-box domain-containing protein n=1 Tax=Mycena metata TaxID=1033252 RepID=A0AAD7KG95_9AGAR|nr:hypothetical protein B0H16DRAFT_1681629 [Mycena metata]